MGAPPQQNMRAQSRVIAAPPLRNCFEISKPSSVTACKVIWPASCLVRQSATRAQHGGRPMRLSPSVREKPIAPSKLNLPLEVRSAMPSSPMWNISFRASHDSHFSAHCLRTTLKMGATKRAADSLACTPEGSNLPTEPGSRATPFQALRDRASYHISHRGRLAQWLLETPDRDDVLLVASAGQLLHPVGRSTRVTTGMSARCVRGRARSSQPIAFPLR